MRICSTQRHLVALGSAVFLAAAALAPGAMAASCSERHKACVDFCAKQYGGGSKCTNYCAEAKPQCLQTGCWVTPQSNKCGFDKK